MQQYWNILTEKFNITRESGQHGANKALRSWYLRKHNADLRSFKVELHQGFPWSVDIELDVPSTPEDRRVFLLGEGDQGPAKEAFVHRITRDFVDPKFLDSWNVQTYEDTINVVLTLKPEGTQHVS